MHIQRREDQPRQQGLVLQGLDQHVHRLFLEVDQDFFQRIFNPGHLGGDVNPDFTQGPGLVL
ncbi:hypothetical protein D3C84_1238730 [compost metagenome]